MQAHGLPARNRTRSIFPLIDIEVDKTAALFVKLRESRCTLLLDFAPAGAFTGAGSWQCMLS
jgi:hypothetical protein